MSMQQVHRKGLDIIKNKQCTLQYTNTIFQLLRLIQAIDHDKEKKKSRHTVEI